VVRHLLVLSLLAAAVLSAAQNANYTPDPNWQAPAAAAERPNPLAGNANAVGGGRKLFERHCAQCHGRDGRGLRNAADLQLPLVQAQPDGALFWKITNGNPRRGMPSFSGLPELQRWQLVLYLRSLVAEAPSGGKRPLPEKK
jgi:cytochrome c oxidase cbb3-type subunit 2